ncbi:hypothetical protein U1Q18_050171 [Sarracenia purpurea var. burkii]
MYLPASQLPSLQVETPDSMFYEGQKALQKLKDYLVLEWGEEMTVDEFVRLELRYKSIQELSKALMAEQIDSVALAIYQVKMGNVLHGYKPIVLTEKPSLFTDLFRDLIDVGMEDGSQKVELKIGSVEQDIQYPNWENLSEEEQRAYENNPENYENFKAQNPTKTVFKYKKNPTYDLSSGKHCVPFIVNARDADSAIRDDTGNILYKAPDKIEQEAVIKSKELPDKYDFILATYSQVASSNKTIWLSGVKNILKGPKASFLVEMAQNNIIILDESHNASGGFSTTGIIMKEIVRASAGTVFLSATLPNVVKIWHYMD